MPAEVSNKADGDRLGVGLDSTGVCAPLRAYFIKVVKPVVATGRRRPRPMFFARMGIGTTAVYRRSEDGSSEQIGYMQ